MGGRIGRVGEKKEDQQKPTAPKGEKKWKKAQKNEGKRTTENGPTLEQYRWEGPWPTHVHWNTSHTHWNRGPRTRRGVPAKMSAINDLFALKVFRSRVWLRMAVTVKKNRNQPTWRLSNRYLCDPLFSLSFFSSSFFFWFLALDTGSPNTLAPVSP